MGQQIVAECPVDAARAGERGLPRHLRLGGVGRQRVERLARLADPGIELGQLGLLLDRRRRDERRRVDVLERLAPLGNVVEVGQDLVELLLRERVELVVVAAGATERQAEPDRRRRLDAVYRVLDEELVDDDAPLAVLAVVAVEGGGDALPAGPPGSRSPASCSMVNRSNACWCRRRVTQSASATRPLAVVCSRCVGVAAASSTRTPSAP